MEFSTTKTYHTPTKSMIPTKKMVQLRVDMVSAQYSYYKLQQNKKRTNPQIHDSDFHSLSWPFFVVTFFGGGSKALQNPALPPLPVYSKRCLRHVPIKVVRNFAAPGKQCLSKQIVGLAEAAEAVYLRGIHIHIHMHMHIHVHIHIYLYLYTYLSLSLSLSIHRSIYIYTCHNPFQRTAIPLVFTAALLHSKVL